MLAAALRLVDEHGADWLSMRKLGASLGVEAMSLYNHVRSREDLLDGLVELMVETYLRPPAPRSAWEISLSEFARDIRATARAHPAAFELVGLRPVRTTSSQAAVRGLVEVLREAGFGAEEAAALYRLVAAFARGFALAEIRGFTLGEPGASANAGLDREVAAALTRESSATFEDSLGIIVRGARSVLADQKPPGPDSAPNVSV